MIKALRTGLFVLTLAVLFTATAHAATITVTAGGVNRDPTPAADGVCTLREAIISINNGADLNADVTANRTGAVYGTNDTINFNYPGGGVISLANALGALTISKTMAIMGFTELGATPNSAVTGDNSTHTVLISGFNLNAGVDCIDITGQASSGTVIRGVVFDQCPGSGITITNSKNNVIAGDFFGTDSAGNFFAGAGNGTGISITALAGTDDISGNQIGGPNPADRNVVSGNSTREILIGNFGGGTVVSTGISVQNSYIGINAAGTTSVGGGQGIFISDITGATIGGASNSLGGSCSGVCNLISGSTGSVGVAVQGSSPTSTSGTLIQGNFFGTDVTGTLARPNGQNAHIDISQSTTVTIGGTAAGTGNLLSGEAVQGTGILIDGGVVGPVNIQGNFVGTTTTGNATLGNGGPGIHVVGSTNVNIGGTVAGARNVIGGNGNGNTPKGPGIMIEGNSPFSTGTAIIQGNNIGIGADGVTSIGNIGDGIDFTSTSTGSTVGASSSGGAGANIIANNGSGRTNGAGIGIANSSSSKILSNSIFNNTGISTGIGIDLSAAGGATDGPTANDNCDGDAGGNNLQNFPVITSATTNGASITIAGTLNSTASTTFTIEFFSNPAATVQGKTFLGSTTTSTNGACNANFNATLAQAVAVGLNITATATDPSGNTSEFSAAVASTAPPVDLTASKTHVGNFTKGDTGKTYTITVSNAGVNPSSGLVTLADSLPAGLIARALSGGGWTCDAIPGGGTPGPATLNCTRSDALAAGNSYPQITLTVDVSCSAGASVTNSATVSGGGDAVPGNNTANDPTTINPDTTPPVITCPGGITKFVDPGQTTATVNPGTPVGTDNCGVPTITGVRSDGKPLNAPYPIGVTLITWTAKDAANNTASCTQTIVVMVPSTRRIP